MNAKHQEKLAVINRLATAATDGADLSQTAQAALDTSAQLVGLTAASMYLWNDKMEPTVNVTYAESDESRRKLLGLETELFHSLRAEKNLMAAYLSFGGEKPYHIFTLPLQFSGKLFGALIGIQEGKRTAEIDNLFLETLSAVISLTLAADQTGLAAGISKEILDKARLTAITDTAVTVNHEVNNPLTAILGNVQLLLSKQEGLSKDAVSKLKVVEESALKIKDVTQKLLKLTHARSVEYTDGATMLDISDEEEGKT